MVVNTSKLSKGPKNIIVYNIIIILTITCNYTLAVYENGNGENNASAKEDPQTIIKDNEIDSEIQDLNIEETNIHEIQEHNEFLESIQIGITETIRDVTSKAERKLNHIDFMTIRDIEFKSWIDDNESPPRHHKGFFFVAYTPYVFRYLRSLFGIDADDYIEPNRAFPLREKSNPSASGSKLYISNNNRYIMKSLQATEGDFLRQLLPFYKKHMEENPGSMLPNYSGFYEYICGTTKIKLISMNNLLPSQIKMHTKYDLKGSSYKRTATTGERLKKLPTLKDNDFKNEFTDGLYLMKNTLSDVLQTIEKDCNFLTEYNIMDYSILLCIYNIDQDTSSETIIKRAVEARWKRLMNVSIGMVDIQADTATFEDEKSCPFLRGSIPAENRNGERLLLFVGIIDMLQNYRTVKVLEHVFKTFVQSSDISIQPPTIYASRFINFLKNSVFKQHFSLEEREAISNNIDDSVPHKRLKISTDTNNEND